MTNTKSRRFVFIFSGESLIRTCCKEARFLRFTGFMNFFLKNLLFILFPGHLGSERPQEEKMNAKSMFYQKLEKWQCVIVECSAV